MMERVNNDIDISAQNVTIMKQIALKFYQMRALPHFKTGSETWTEKKVNKD
jgi:hypothetical protein